MNYINLTPFSVKLLDPLDRSLIANFESQGNATCRVITEIKMSNGVPVGELKFGEIKGLPEPKEGCSYIVSKTVFEKAKQEGRCDVCFVSSKTMRNEFGEIVFLEFLAF